MPATGDQVPLVSLDGLEPAAQILECARQIEHGAGVGGILLQCGPQQLDVPLAPLDEAVAVAVAVIMPHDDARITQHLCAGRPTDDLCTPGPLKSQRPSLRHNRSRSIA